jgi:hypothetical protein
MRNLQRQNITSIRVELDKQICSPDTNAIITPDEILDKLEDHILKNLEDDLHSIKQFTTSNRKKKNNLTFLFEYLLESIGDDTWIHDNTKAMGGFVQKGKQILTSVSLRIKEEKFFKRIESLDTSDFSEDEDTELARYRIVFNMNTLCEIQMQCCLDNDLGKIEWFDEDGNECYPEDPYIRQQLRYLVSDYEDFNPQFLENLIGIVKADMLSAAFYDESDYEKDAIFTKEMADTYFYNQEYNRIELTYIKDYPITLF